MSFMDNLIPSILDCSDGFREKIFQIVESLVGSMANMSLTDDLFCMKVMTEYSLHLFFFSTYSSHVISWQ